MSGLIGRKVGMTQVFDDHGHQIPVTVVEVGPCVVVQRKTRKKDGYEAVQLGFADQKKSRLTRPVRGQFDKAEVAPKKTLREFRIEDGSELKVGDELSASLFDGVSFVDVVSNSKGRGFQGVMKRYNFGGGRASHGSGTHRRPGSIGQCVSPSRVMKNRKMPGQTGNTRIKVQNLKVISVRPDDNVILLRGAVPGPNGGTVLVSKALKKA